MKKSLGLYLHIPFCLKKCNYCDFCSFPGTDDVQMNRYANELCRRMEQSLPDPREWQIDTVYFGGGTPTLLPIENFSHVFEVLRRKADLAPDCEITCECNPATADFAKLSALHRLGVNRLSLGLQSTDDHELALLGRAHDYRQFLQTFFAAREAGFDNISVDLMYGIPDQTPQSFEKSLSELAELAPEHISSYCLSIEEGTAFARCRDSLKRPDEDEEYAMYCTMTELLSRYGYQKYEISNFAKPGYPSRHNLRYWQRKDYLGFGVAAHSCFSGIRFGNSRDLRGFLDGKDITEERYVLGDYDRLCEWILLGLRTAAGLDEAAFEKKTGKRLDFLCPRLSYWVENGCLRRENGRIFFVDRGFFVSNSVLSDLLDFAPEAERFLLDSERLSEKNC